MIDKEIREKQEKAAIMDVLPETKEDSLPAITDEAMAETGLINPNDRLIELAIKSEASIEYLERLMDLKERWEAAQAEKAFSAAMARFQGACPVIPKNKQVRYQTRNNDWVDYSYSTLDVIVEHIKKPLADNELFYSFEETREQNELTVTCVLQHKDGWRKTSTRKGAPDNSGSKNAIQSDSSAYSYLRRGTLTAVTGAVAGDGDPDGRLPMDETQMTDAAKEIVVKISQANNEDELKEAGQYIARLPEGREKQTLKGHYYERKEALDGGRSEQGDTDRESGQESEVRSDSDG